MTSNNQNPLYPVWQAYFCSKTGLQVARKCLFPETEWQPYNVDCQESVNAYKRHLLNHLDSEELSNLSGQSFETAKTENEDLFVLALWATFERFIRNFMLEKGSVLENNITPTELGQYIYEHYQKEVEYWKPKEMLKVLENSFATTEELKNTFETAVTVIRYRDWVAHGKNPNKPPSAINAVETYKTLKIIIDSLLSS